MPAQKNSLRFLIWIFLLIAGFFAGIAWKNAPAPQSGPSAGEADSLSTFVATPGNDPGDGRPTAPQQDLTPEELANIKLFQEASPSVCFITTSNVRQDFFSRDISEIPRGTGSGFVWDRQGHIVTNFHVIQGADRAQVTLADRSTYDAELVGYASEKDLAVLKIKAPATDLKPIPVGASQNLLVGQIVYAIGNPFGLDQTLTKGIISALGREIESVARIPIRDVIQTDAAINPGNSGGPLLDSSGRLIGVNTAIYSPSGASAGIGFSIPVDEVRWVVPELIQFGKIQRPSLGVTLVPQTYYRSLGIESGALVYRVTPGSQADRAGLRSTQRDRYGRVSLGDVIVQIGNEPIEEVNDIQLALEKFEAGQSVPVIVIRDGERTSLDIVLEEAKN